MRNSLLEPLKWRGFIIEEQCHLEDVRGQDALTLLNQQLFELSFDLLENSTGVIFYYVHFLYSKECGYNKLRHKCLIIAEQLKQ